MKKLILVADLPKNIIIKATIAYAIHHLEHWVNKTVPMLLIINECINQKKDRERGIKKESVPARK